MGLPMGTVRKIAFRMLKIASTNEQSSAASLCRFHQRFPSFLMKKYGFFLIDSGFFPEY